MLFIRTAVEAASARGFDLSEALAVSGIPRELLADERARCTPEQITRFVREVWKLSDDELFGLGRAPVPHGTFRLICYALISAPDLGAMLDRWAGFGPALASLPAFQVEVGEQVTRIEVDMNGIDDPGHLISDFTLMLLHRFSGWLVGQRIRLLSLELPYPQPPHADDYDLIFGAPATFDAPRPAIAIESKLLGLPVVRSEQELIEYLKHSPADLMARRDYGTTLAEQVRRILETGLRGDWPTFDDVATRLSISPQHIRRRLRDEGTSMGQIKEELLRDAAISGLARGTPVDQLSAKLGFSEPSAFRRAFKRWTGSSPGAYQVNRTAG